MNFNRLHSDSGWHSRENRGGQVFPHHRHLPAGRARGADPDRGSPHRIPGTARAQEGNLNHTPGIQMSTLVQCYTPYGAKT